MKRDHADDPVVREHLDNVEGNLQLIADLAYGDAALAVARHDGTLTVAADSRPMTALAAMAATRRGRALARRDEPEAYAALEGGVVVRGERRRSTRGIAYTTSAWPVFGPDGAAVAVIIVDVTLQAVEAPGRMERSFMDLAEGLLVVLGANPLRDLDTGEPFETTRVAGDGVLSVDCDGTVRYASPNAVNIMKGAGHEGALAGGPAAALPGGEQAIAPALGAHGALGTEVATGGRVLSYRTVALPSGALVLVEDLTDLRRRDQEIKVKDATIREVHHRVKNNLQTIASLLRIQARRSGSPEASRSLREAVERISSMAVVHEQLTGSDDERVDFADSARTIVEMVRSGLAGSDSRIVARVEGSTGDVPAQVATSLALLTAELVHNAIEHGVGPRGAGTVTVSLRRLGDEIKVVVKDDGLGLPDGFDPEVTANLGLAIVKTVVEDDLKGTLTFSSGRGTTVTVRVPTPDA
jgi:two-component system, sensor histidine kinase PdtaS